MYYTLTAAVHPSEPTPSGGKSLLERATATTHQNSGESRTRKQETPAKTKRSMTLYALSDGSLKEKILSSKHTAVKIN